MPDNPAVDGRLMPSRYVRVTITERGGMLLDLRERHGRWFVLTPAATVWWRHIQEGCTTGQANQAVADRYGISSEQATADLTPFIGTLLRRRLLRAVRSHDTACTR